MGPLPTKPGQNKDVQIVNDGLFYGVHVPQPAPEEETVFVEKSEALKLVKKYKRARFKSFRTRQDATEFALYGTDVCSSTSLSTTIESLATISLPSALTVGEKPSPFKGPKSQDMVRLRKAIESGDFEFVQKTVWENPRYLVSSGDTPAILQEGSRYNALHVAAKSGDATIAAYVLTTVSSTDFIRKLYGDYNAESENVEERCRVLLDLYLNTPDKGVNDTPLHFATKFGAARVVQVLTAYPQCNKLARNKFQQTPKDVVCSRTNNADANLKAEILSYLEEQFFVPVLRSEDDCVPATVGQPFSPTSPLELKSDIVSPSYEVQAMAGPMPMPQAVAFRRRWKTPPRIPGTPASPVCHLNDPDKGWEKVGRELAREYNVSWQEYWPFLNTYTDLSTDDGLHLLEEFLKTRFKQASYDYGTRNSFSKTPTSEKSTSPNKSVQTENHTVEDVCVVSPISELCIALKACTLNSEGKVLTRNPPPPPPPPRTVLPTHQSMNGDVSHNSKKNIAVSSYLFMETYCQTFAKRISDSLQRNIDSGSEVFNKELGQFCSLLTSCTSSENLLKFDFSKLHSRLGYCVAQKIVQYEPHEVLAIANIICQNISRKADDSSSEEDEVCRTSDTYRKRGGSFRSIINKKIIQQAILCISKAILKALEELETCKTPPLSDITEEVCEELWSRRESCQCVFQRARTDRRHYEQGAATKKLIFTSDECDDAQDQAVSNDSKISRDCCEPSSGEESDESDSESSEFFTPPSSPISQLSAVNSEDDLGMESSDEGPDVYIWGNMPSKLDNAVLEAIENESISLVKYPNICRWRHLVLLHSSCERERWQTPFKKKLKDHNSSCSTPPSHKSTPSYIPRFDNLRRNKCENFLSLPHEHKA